MTTYRTTETARGKFRFSVAGTPTDPSGLVLSVYDGDSVTQSTTGVTTTVPFDSVTGLLHWAVDLSTYAADTDYQVIATAGTLDGKALAGTVIAEFTTRVAPVDVIKLLGVAATPDTVLEGKIDTIDSLVDAIKAVTDQFAFTVANQVDANALSGGGGGGGDATEAKQDTIIGYLDTEIAAIKAKTDVIPADPATETTLAALDSLLDAIKLVTDKFRFTVANEVDANAVTGGGTVDPAVLQAAIDSAVPGALSSAGYTPGRAAKLDDIETMESPVPNPGTPGTKGEALRAAIDEDNDLSDIRAKSISIKDDTTIIKSTVDEFVKTRPDPDPNDLGDFAYGDTVTVAVPTAVTSATEIWVAFSENATGAPAVTLQKSSGGASLSTPNIVFTLPQSVQLSSMQAKAYYVTIKVKKSDGTVVTVTPEGYKSVQWRLTLYGSPLSNK